jgi:FAD/FMN-containing dehydrogenase
MSVCLRGYDNKDLYEKLNKEVTPFVMQFVKEVCGSVSAEHGIGIQKKSFLDYSKSQPMIEYMRRIKNVFDPNGIMNPYKVLPHK